MESKKCTQCGKDLDISEFHKSNKTKDGLRWECKQCRREYTTINKEIIALKRKQYYELHKEEELKKRKQYYELHKEEELKKSKQYYKDNKEKISRSRRYYYNVNNEVFIKKIRQYYLKNKERIKQYYLNNKKKISKHGKQYRASNAKYKVYHNKLTVEELPRLHDDGISLEVLCKYCGKYFIPTTNNIKHRVEALYGDGGKGDGFLYCSDNCKTSCPIYGQVKYPKGFKKASSREVNSLVRQMCFKRDGWLCQICGKSVDEVQLHCHHIESYAQNPVLGNDIENVITLCKECHKEVHKLPGCHYNELRCD